MIRRAGYLKNGTCIRYKNHGSPLIATDHWIGNRRLFVSLNGLSELCERQEQVYVYASDTIPKCVGVIRDWRQIR